MDVLCLRTSFCVTQGQSTVKLCHGGDVCMCVYTRVRVCVWWHSSIFNWLSHTLWKKGWGTDWLAGISLINNKAVCSWSSNRHAHKLEAAPQVIWIHPLQRSTTGKLVMGFIFSLWQQWANNTVDVWICTVYLNAWLAFLGASKERSKNWHSHELKTDVMCHQSSKIQHERRRSYEMVKRDSGKMVKKAMNHLFSQNKKYRKKKVSQFLDQSLRLNNRDDRWPTWWCHRSPSCLPLKNIQGAHSPCFLVLGLLRELT